MLKWGVNGILGRTRVFFDESQSECDIGRVFEIRKAGAAEDFG